MTLSDDDVAVLGQFEPDGFQFHASNYN
jgi:hypothetical protein